MSLVASHTSELIRSPKSRHISILERHEDFVWDHIAYCRDKVGPCLVMLCSIEGRVGRGYLPEKHCSVISLMTFGLEEHEAIEVLKRIQRCDLKTQAAVLITEDDFKSGNCSFIEVEI